MKGIIVVDIQEDCHKCKLYSHSFGCKIKMKKYMVKGIPDWCPIKPMPERAYHENYCDGGRYDEGWNKCIDEILKGE